VLFWFYKRRETYWRPKTTLRTPDILLHKIAGHPRHVCPLQQFRPPPPVPPSRPSPLTSLPASRVPQGRTPPFRMKQAEPPSFSLVHSTPLASFLSLAEPNQGGSASCSSPERAQAGQAWPPRVSSSFSSPSFPSSPQGLLQSDCFSQFSPIPVKQKSSLISSIIEFPQLLSLWIVFPHPRWASPAVFPSSLKLWKLLH
jgi:hypothetical protein